MRHARRATGLLALLGLLACTQPDRAVSICEATEDGALKDGAEVRLAAVFSTDGAQVGFFRDNDCAQVDVALFLDEETPGAKALYDQVSAAAGPGQPLQRYRVDVSGVFHDQYGVTSNALLATRVNAFERIE